MATQANNLIARIESMGTALKGENDTKMVQMKLKEANGKTFEWSSFHVGILKEYEVGDVIEIEPKLVWKDGNKYPFRNIESVLGKREASEINTLDVLAQKPGALAEAPGSTNGTYDQGKAIERQSIEGQTSLKLVVELFKAGCSVDDLESVVAAVIKAAIPFEEHLVSLKAQPTIPAPSVPTGAATHTNGASSTNDESKAADSHKMETVGDLFTAALRKPFKKSKSDVLDALGCDSQEELLERMTPQTAWGQLQNIWGGPPAKEDTEN